MFCNSCGKEIPADSKFCVVCGAKFLPEVDLPKKKKPPKKARKNVPSRD